MPCVQLRAVFRLDEYFPHRGKALADFRAARLRQRLTVENQRVLREVDHERQTNHDRQRNLEDRGDQVLLYISPPLRTNSTDFSFIPCST